MSSVFQEFQLSITPLGSDDYLVRTEKVAPGVPLAEERLHWPVGTWLDRAKKLMNDPLLNLMQEDGSPQDDFLFITGQLNNGNTQEAILNLASLGRNLYEELFQGSLRDSWIAAQSIAYHHRSVLRLRLGMKGSRLSRIPWEVLHANRNELGESLFQPLATGTDIAFSRYQMGSPFAANAQQLTVNKERPLRILMAIAEPDDQDNLALQQEALNLKAELERNAREGFPQLELTILEQPGREELTQALEQGNYQVFHYAGHSNLGESGGDVYLVSNTTGLTERLYGKDLAGLLANNGIQLAVFNSCRSADTALDEEKEDGEAGDRNLARTLVKRGIPAVLAMAERIPDEVALTLTRLLYRNLVCSYPIDLSLSRARQGLISAYGSNQLYWALPVLYLHPDFDGVLVTGQGKIEGFDPLDFYDLEEMPMTGETAWLEDDLADDFEDFTEDDDYLAPSSPNDKADTFYERTNDTPGRASDRLPLDETTIAEEESFVRNILSDFEEEKEEEGTEGNHSPVTHHTSPIEEQSSQSTTQAKGKKNPLQIALLAGLGAIAIAGGSLGTWYAYNTYSNSNQLPTTLNADIPLNGEELDFQDINTDRVTSLAIEQFSTGNLSTGSAAVRALLDRNALPFAASALAVVPTAQLDEPEISFLRGRLAWQAVFTGDDTYHITDARRYWEIATKGQPDAIAYKNALGFAYYAEGQTNRANQVWYDALALSDTQTENPDLLQNPDILNTYAGLALGLQKLSTEASPEQAKILADKARKLRQTVMNAAPLQFQAQGLSRNWLWSEQAIQDWQKL
ncbi:CHAT domain-containing protein [Spirulina sp. 06S082]|uniref:CHAT domain-containing protein n=1 Tax=Spirulina sp. 06S082 TaxID=3110248 RepID=UPI002B21C852|nr:CHAT domain-containing protein [Spirulina sp. 06S082]MEA5468870.1 CHAT domain-containing protein [Spirulina sp. 06S082]